MNTKDELEKEVKEALDEGYRLYEIREALIEDGYSRGLTESIISEFEENNRRSKNSELKKESTNPQENINNTDIGKQQEPHNQNFSKSNKLQGKMRSPLKVALFSVLSVGLYVIYWEYVFFKYSLSDVYENESKRRVMALGVFIVSWIPPFTLVGIYFLYKVLKIGSPKKNIFVRMLLYAVLLSLGLTIPVALYLMQKDVNKCL